MVESELKIESSLQDNAYSMNRLIKIKEYELLEMQETRNKELEYVIINKDKQLLEYVNIMELLKNDFQFNLKLLEARDNEIIKYKNELELKSHEMDLFEKDKILLLQRIEELTNREITRIHSIEQEKVISKVRL